MRHNIKISILLFLALNGLCFFPKLQNIARAQQTDKIMPERLKYLDHYAINTPKINEKNFKTLASYLVKPAKNNLEKVRLIFRWVAENIKYDDEAFNSDK